MDFTSIVTEGTKFGFSVLLLIGAVYWLQKRNEQKETELKEAHRLQIENQKETSEQLMELHRETLTTVSNNTQALGKLTEIIQTSAARRSSVLSPSVKRTVVAK